MTTDVTSTEELADGNWLYQVHSHLEFTPTSGEKITCKVEHASLKEPKLYDWGKRVTWSLRMDLMDAKFIRNLQHFISLIVQYLIPMLCL